MPTVSPQSKKPKPVKNVVSNSRYSKLKVLPHRYQEGVLSNLDGRFRIAKDLKRSAKALMNDLGGMDRLSYQQRSLCERAIFIEFLLSDWEQQIASNVKEIDCGKYTQMSNALLGLYRTLGLERKSKDVPELKNYIQAGSSS